MNKELLVKAWIVLILITAVLFYFIGLFSLLLPSNSPSIFFILHVAILLLAIPISIIGMGAKAKFSTVLLVLVPVFFFFILLLFFAASPGPDVVLLSREYLLSSCKQQMQGICQQNYGDIPSGWNSTTWNAKTIKLGNEIISCFELTNCSTCEECGFTPS